MKSTTSLKVRAAILSLLLSTTVVAAGCASETPKPVEPEVKTEETTKTDTPTSEAPLQAPAQTPAQTPEYSVGTVDWDMVDESIKSENNDLIPLFSSIQPANTVPTFTTGMFTDVSTQAEDYKFDNNVSPMSLTYENFYNGTIGNLIESELGKYKNYKTEDTIKNSSLSRAFMFSTDDSASSKYSVKIHGAGASFEKLTIELHPEDGARDKCISGAINIIRALTGDRAGAAFTLASNGELSLNNITFIPTEVGECRLYYYEYKNTVLIEMSRDETANVIYPSVTEYLVDGQNVLSPSYFDNDELLKSLNLGSEYTAETIVVSEGHLENVTFSYPNDASITINYRGENKTLSLSCYFDGSIENALNYTRGILSGYKEELSDLFSENTATTSSAIAEDYRAITMSSNSCTVTIRQMDTDNFMIDITLQNT